MSKIGQVTVTKLETCLYKDRDKTHDIKHSIRLVQYIPWHLQNTFKKITNTIKETRE